MIDTNQKKNLSLLNTVREDFNKALEKNLNLYALTYRFNYLRNFRGGGEGERLAEERVLFWFKGVLKRLYARPWREELFAYIFFDTEGLSGPHAHGLIAISDQGYRERYAGRTFDQCFEGDDYNRWIIKSDSHGEKDLLKSYWVDSWDGETGLLRYSAKSYEWGGSFWSSNPMYISGELCTPVEVREKRMRALTSSAEYARL